MAEFINGKTANEVWKKATTMLLDGKNAVTSRVGDAYEILHTFITIENPRQKWIYDRIPPISIGYAFAELVWMMNGEERSDIINYWNPSLPKYAGKGKVYHGAYGKRIRSHFGFDQLEKAYHALQNVPESRQVVIQIYDTKIDFPITNGQPRNEDIPCNICSLPKVRCGKLEWSQIMRSNDVIMGMPYDFVQFTGLQEILAGWLELEVGAYSHYSDSLHLYIRDENKIGIGQESEMENSDSLSISKNESEKLFKEMFERMKNLMQKTISENDIYSNAILGSQYIAYNNIMLIIAAYIAYKKKNMILAQELVEKCTNNVYVTLWHRWSEKYLYNCV